MKRKLLRKALVMFLVAITLIACTGCTSDTENNSESQASSTEFSEEDALAIAEGGFHAMKAKDSVRIVEYTNVDILYYMANQEYVGGEELIAFIDTLTEESTDTYNSLGIIGILAAFENVEFYEVEPFPAEEIDKLNAFVLNKELFGEADSFNYTIENAYKLKISYDGVEEEDFEEGNEPYVLVVYANDEWKLDICISMMKELYDSLNEPNYN